MTEYRKYGYWLDAKEFPSVKKGLEEKASQASSEVYLPCRVLKSSVEMGFVAPSAWNGFCKRRTSWYWKSDKAKKFLIVSNKPVDTLSDRETISIAESDFKPEVLPSLKEILDLAESEEFRKRKPRKWDEPSSTEKEFYEIYHKRLGATHDFDLDQLLKYHSANHANFLTPRFYVLVNDTRVPHSLADSLHVCSSCLEFFNILGNQWPLKYVVACIGAVKFAGLPIDRYFAVRTSGGVASGDTESAF